MVRDIIIAVLITLIAIALGVAVNPLLLFIIVLAIIWLLARRGAWA